MSVRILVGHVLDRLRELPDESVHCVVTSPPYYGLRDYGIEPQVWGDWRGSLGLEPTLALYLDHMVEVFREARRVMRKDATCWLNIGDAFCHDRLSSAMRSDYQADDGLYQRRADYIAGKMPKRSGNGLKPKDLMLIPARLAIRLQEDGWWVRSDIAWCLSGGTRVYARTQKGDMPTTIKDLVRLDPATVKLWNGDKWTQVLGWGQVPRPDKTYEIEFRSGERVGCTAEHKWPAEGRGDVPAEYLVVGDVVQTCRLPQPDVPRTPSALDDQDIGWIVGTFLADGSWAKDGTAFNIASNANETARFSRIQEIAERYDGAFSITWKESNGATAIVHSRILAAVIKTYLSGENADGKHLNVRCWQRSDTFLHHLLLGYLEGDGHWETTAKRWRISFCQNDALAVDIRTLGARLGYQVRLRRHVHQSQWGDYSGWRGEIRFAPSDRCKNDGEIVAIRESRARKFWDIAVEDEPHLFALASGILTHNCKRAPMPESCTDRPTSAWEHVFLLTKSARYYYDAEAVKEEAEYGRRDIKGEWRGGAYVNQKGAQNNSEGNGGSSSVTGKHPETGRNQRNVWLLGPEPFPLAHFATFPTEIPRRAILAGTSERGVCPKCAAPWERVVKKTFRVTRTGSKAGAKGLDASSGWDQEPSGVNDVEILGWRPTCGCGIAETSPATILDCFGGSGTSGLVADRLGRDAILVELNPEYATMARRRVEDDAGLFAEVAD